MKFEDIKTISVLGSGIMGHGIAQTFLMAGYLFFSMTSRVNTGNSKGAHQ